MSRSAIAWVVMATLFAGVIVLGVNLADTEPQTSPSPLLNQPAPTFTLTDLDSSEDISLADYRGQVVVINFFASWCLACKVEHADLTAAANTAAAEDVVFVGITYLDNPEDARGFLDENGRASSGHYVYDESGFTAIEYGLFGIPETFFVDSQGVVRAKITGPANLGLILDTIDKVKAGDTPGITETGPVQGSRDS